MKVVCSDVPRYYTVDAKVTRIIKIRSKSYKKQRVTVILRINVHRHNYQLIQEV
jgi:hypothetical protein